MVASSRFLLNGFPIVVLVLHFDEAVELPAIDATRQDERPRPRLPRNLGSHRTVMWQEGAVEGIAPTTDSILTIGMISVIVLVLANGFFVASVFPGGGSRSRVVQLAASGPKSAVALRRATEQLDINVAACQWGITTSSLALGWIGEVDLAHLLSRGLGQGAIAPVEVPIPCERRCATSCCSVVSVHIHRCDR